MLEFCSSWMCPQSIADGDVKWKMCRLPWKIIRHLPYTHSVHGKRQWTVVAREKVQCEALCNRGVPVIGALCGHYLKRVPGPNPGVFNSDECQRLVEHYYDFNATVTPEGRELFARKFGVSIADQIDCESYLDNLPRESAPDHYVLRQLAEP